MIGQGLGALIEIKSKRTNHTGYAALNLWHHNVWTMFKYELRKDGRPYFGWRREIKRQLESLLFGWEPHHCRLRWK